MAEPDDKKEKKDGQDDKPEGGSGGTSEEKETKDVVVDPDVKNDIDFAKATYEQILFLIAGVGRDLHSILKLGAEDKGWLVFVDGGGQGRGRGKEFESGEVENSNKDFLGTPALSYTAMGGHVWFAAKYNDSLLSDWRKAISETTAPMMDLARGESLNLSVRSATKASQLLDNYQRWLDNAGQYSAMWAARLDSPDSEFKGRAAYAIQGQVRQINWVIERLNKQMAQGRNVAGIGSVTPAEGLRELALAVLAFGRSMAGIWYSMHARLIYEIENMLKAYVANILEYIKGVGIVKGEPNYVFEYSRAHTNWISLNQYINEVLSSYSSTKSSQFVGFDKRGGANRVSSGFSGEWGPDFVDEYASTQGQLTWTPPPLPNGDTISGDLRSAQVWNTINVKISNHVRDNLLQPMAEPAREAAAKLEQAFETAKLYLQQLKVGNPPTLGTAPGPDLGGDLGGDPGGDDKIKFPPPGGGGDTDFKLPPSSGGGGDTDFKLPPSSGGGGDTDFKLPPPGGGGDNDFKLPPSSGGGGDTDFKLPPPGGGGDNDFKPPPSSGGDNDFKFPPSGGETEFKTPPGGGGGNDFQLPPSGGGGDSFLKDPNGQLGGAPPPFGTPGFPGGGGPGAGKDPNGRLRVPDLPGGDNDSGDGWKPDDPWARNNPDLNTDRPGGEIDPNGQVTGPKPPGEDKGPGGDGWKPDDPWERLKTELGGDTPGGNGKLNLPPGESGQGLGASDVGGSAEFNPPGGTGTGTGGSGDPGAGAESGHGAGFAGEGWSDWSGQLAGGTPGGGSSGSGAGNAQGLGGGMPMMPPMMPPMGGMGGMGGGGNNGGRERERQTWLSEDEEVWGADVEAGSGVIGRPDGGPRITDDVPVPTHVHTPTKPVAGKSRRDKTDKRAAGAGDSAQPEASSSMADPVEAVEPVKAAQPTEAGRTGEVHGRSS